MRPPTPLPTRREIVWYLPTSFFFFNTIKINKKWFGVFGGGGGGGGKVINCISSYFNAFLLLHDNHSTTNNSTTTSAERAAGYGSKLHSSSQDDYRDF